MRKSKVRPRLDRATWLALMDHAKRRRESSRTVLSRFELRYFLLEKVIMLPMEALRLQFGNLLATDTTTLDQSANANVVALITAPFTPSETLTIGDLTLATFTGNAPIAAVLGAQEVGIDPATGNQIITIVPPSGGWRWITGDAVNLPQTVYGFALCTHALGALLAVGVLLAPLTLQAAGEQIDLGVVEIAISQTPTVGNN